MSHRVLSSLNPKFSKRDVHGLYCFCSCSVTLGQANVGRSGQQDVTGRRDRSEQKSITPTSIWRKGIFKKEAVSMNWWWGQSWAEYTHITNTIDHTFKWPSLLSSSQDGVDSWGVGAPKTEMLDFSSRMIFPVRNIMCWNNQLPVHSSMFICSQDMHNFPANVQHNISFPHPFHFINVEVGKGCARFFLKHISP